VFACVCCDSKYNLFVLFYMTPLLLLLLLLLPPPLCYCSSLLLLYKDVPRLRSECQRRVRERTITGQNGGASCCVAPSSSVVVEVITNANHQSAEEKWAQKNDDDKIERDKFTLPLTTPAADAPKLGSIDREMERKVHCNCRLQRRPHQIAPVDVSRRRT